ncbi:hypothetical protein [Ralstonia phage phiRSL1]|uniref:Uncharacterized protein n=1 Tax=Ralstonia phage phiRSL1 TaxID=1980924 RepID=B2ZYI4_9CAUD|nr:PmgG-like head morphogenesis [Ralstonia phage phiRSL1]BAG41652.1 hypothetical protein [Ralstonia phage phiRSL1]
MALNSAYLAYIQQYGVPGSSKPNISVTAPLPDSIQFETDSSYEPLMPQGITDNKTVNNALAVMGVKLAVQSLTAQLWQGTTTGDLYFEVEFHTENDPATDVRLPILNLMKMTTPSISKESGLLISPGPQLDFAQLQKLAKDALTEGKNIFTQQGTTSSSSASYNYNPKVVSTGLGSGLFYPSAMINTNQQSTDGNNTAGVTSTTDNPNLGSAQYWKSLVSNRISIQIGEYLLFDNVVITRIAQTFSSNFDSLTHLPHHVKVGIGFRPMFVLTQDDLDNVYLNRGNSGALLGSGLGGRAGVFNLG